MSLTHTPISEIEAIHAELTATFLSGKTRSIAFRKQQIKQLGFLVQDNEQRFAEALEQDLGRPKAETLFGETAVMKAHVNETHHAVAGWAKAQGVNGGWLWVPAGPKVIPVPKGVTAIISPWNFPISLSLGPLLASIAAGNTAILKPAEQTVNLTNLLAELFPKYLDPTCYRVVVGAAAEVTRLLQLPLDHIFFTGAGKIGKIVAHAAVEQSCPFTLELGGKSPALVFADCDFYKTARRIMWGKWTNAGQICIAPDFALCDTPETEAKLVEAIKQVITEFEGGNGPAVEGSGYSSIVNKAHYGRITNLIDNTKGTIVINGGRNEAKLKIGTVIVTDVKEDDVLMEDEIFGPIMPILVKTKEEMVAYLNKLPSPLAIYYFGSSKATRDFLFANTRSGQFVQGDVVTQFIIPNLPFGGVGPSGTGAYHGKFGFDEFSHLRADLSVPMLIEAAQAAKYPPYTDGKLKQLMMVMGATVKKDSWF